MIWVNFATSIFRNSHNLDYSIFARLPLYNLLRALLRPNQTCQVATFENVRCNGEGKRSSNIEFQQISILISWYISFMLIRSRHCVYVTLASSFLFRESFWKVCVPIEVFFEPTEKAGKDGKVKQGERKQRHLWINIQFLILGWFLFILGFLKYGRRLKENERNQQKEVNALLMQPFCFQTNPKVGTSKGSQSKSHFSFVSDSRIKKSRDVPSSLLRQPIPARDAAPASGPGESVFFLAGFEIF